MCDNPLFRSIYTVLYGNITSVYEVFIEHTDWLSNREFLKVLAKSFAVTVNQYVRQSLYHEYHDK